MRWGSRSIVRVHWSENWPPPPIALARHSDAFFKEKGGRESWQRGEDSFSLLFGLQGMVTFYSRSSILRYSILVLCQ